MSTIHDLTVLLATAGIAHMGFCNLDSTGQPLFQGERGVRVHVSYGRDYNIAAETTFRDSLKSSIPDGNCFGYGRRYVI